MSKPRRYSAEFKLDAVSRMEHCETITGLAKELGIRRKFLYQWRDQLRAGERVIPLNADAWAVILELYSRSQALGAAEPNPLPRPRLRDGPFRPHARHQKLADRMAAAYAGHTVRRVRAAPKSRRDVRGL